ncbi:matrix protein [Gierle apodemus virus]|uniref:Matrix protein n=1 Tax=Gierle apodemus virus TaxID=2940985 RepID=A0AAE9KXA8_9MONO|nr:matrix protein [Gierle apodemus virus]
MATSWDFDQDSWDTKGALAPIITDTGPDGRLIPKVRVINPGLGDKRGDGVKYLLIHGVVEDVGLRPIGRAFAAFPLGFAKCSATPEDLLKAVLALNITVRRTAGASEKLVFYNTAPLGILSPWSKVLNTGCIFNAAQVCNAVEMIPLDIPQCMRPVYLTVTILSDSGFYQVPKSLQDFRADGCIAFNILVALSVEGNIDAAMGRSADLETKESFITFMLHIGVFKRKKNKTYSTTYCIQKIEKMKLVFALGGIAGVSLHVRIRGKMSKALHAQLGFRRNLVYPLMYVNSQLNRILWKKTCKIDKVMGILQPSVPREFKMYDDIVVDMTDKCTVK